jgi:hypothetical protein
MGEEIGSHQDSICASAMIGAESFIHEPKWLGEKKGQFLGET